METFEVEDVKSDYSEIFLLVKFGLDVEYVIFAAKI